MDEYPLDIMGDSPTSEGRGSAVDLDPEWAKLLRTKFHDLGVSYEEFAEQLRALGTPKGVSKSTVERAINQNSWTDRLVAAFCARFGLENPILAAATPEEIRWFQIGRTLRTLDNSRFQQELHDLGVVADNRRVEHEIDQRRRPKP